MTLVSLVIMLACSCKKKQNFRWENQVSVAVNQISFTILSEFGV